LGFVVFTLAGGSGILAYLIAWVIIPEAGDEASGPRTPAKPLGPQGSLIAGLALVAIGIVLLLKQFVPWFSELLWPMASGVAGLALRWMGLRHDRSGGPRGAHDPSRVAPAHTRHGRDRDHPRGARGALAPPCRRRPLD